MITDIFCSKVEYRIVRKTIVSLLLFTTFYYYLLLILIVYFLFLASSKCFTILARFSGVYILKP